VTPPRLRSRFRWATMPSGTTRGCRDVVRELSAMTTSYDARRADWMTVFFVGAYLVVTRAPLQTSIAILILFLIVMFVLVKISRLANVVAVALVLLLMFGLLNSRHAQAELHDVELGPYSGLATIVSDPRQVGAATEVVIAIGPDRHIVFAYGRPSWRIAGAKVGERIFVDGHRESIEHDRHARYYSRHIKGRFQVTQVGETRLPASPLLRSAQRVRDLVAKSADSFDFADKTLFTGLVIGDDTRQPKAMTQVFRDSGLAHLVAVSGQNVAFVLAAVSPLLSRLDRKSRVVVTMMILFWFVVITRVEPSVVRAAIMAGLAYLSVAIGRPTRTLRLIALTVLVAVIVDPLLAWSIGFYMSVGATLGLCVGAAPLTKVIPGPRWLAQLVAATVAAQIGVMPAVLTVFGLPSATGIIANVLAVPVAGMVMLVGLPMAVPSGLMVGGSLNFLATILMWPVRVGVRWVWWVATVFAELRLTGAINVALWVALLSALLAMRHRSSSLVA